MTLVSHDIVFLWQQAKVIIVVVMMSSHTARKISEAVKF